MLICYLLLFLVNILNKELIIYLMFKNKKKKKNFLIKANHFNYYILKKIKKI